jgi:beta-lactamase regulating signal transducer with metallopeptidase domain
MPAGLAPSLSPTELRHVLLHELAHLRRRDLVWGWISELARVVYFFHPVVHWIAYRARLERELACDQLAMSHSGHDAQEYASTLVRVVSHASEPTVFKTAAGSAGFDGESR